MTWFESAMPSIHRERDFGIELNWFADRPRSFTEMLDAAVARNPRGDALIAGTASLTWSDFAGEVAAVASACACLAWPPATASPC